MTFPIKNSQNALISQAMVGNRENKAIRSQSVSDSLKNNPHIVHAALQHNPMALNHVPASLRNNHTTFQATIMHSDSIRPD